ncbi:MAG: MFS transporter [Dehalococcoidia bacterium]|nr:MFS transporter [Dehalococcoidia bacterium]
MLKRRVIFYGWIVVFATAAMSFGSSGARFSFAAFLKPMTEEFNWDRTSLAGAASLNLLLAGLLRPLGGWLVDRYGPKIFAVWGVAVSATVMLTFSFVSQLWQAYALFMVLSIGYVAGPVVTPKLVGSWFVRRRGLALSIAASGTALGELVITPLAMWMLLASSWQNSYRMLSIILFIVILPISLILLKNSPKEKGTYPDGDQPGSVAANATAAEIARDGTATLGEALRSSTFWKLGIGFFVCGYTMSFANTHFIAFATDMGFEPMLASTALGLIGGCSIIGTVSLGHLSDRFGPRNLLAIVYFLRGTAFAILLTVDSPLPLYLASFVLGLSWTATVPLTAAMATRLWGLRSIGIIFGCLFTLMPLGSALGATLDAWIFDTHHNYQLALWLNLFAGLIASAAVVSIRAKREREKVVEGKGTVEKLREDE